MYAKRIIPCLDLKNGRVVKGTNFVGLRDAGDPVEAARRYDEQGADELVLLDITASSDARNIMIDIVEKVASTIFIPFTVGGGIRSVEDFQKLLTDRQRRVFRLVVDMAMSVKECAGLCGISEPAVIHAMKKIRKKAKKFFGRG